MRKIKLYRAAKILMICLAARCHARAADVDQSTGGVRIISLKKEFIAWTAAASKSEPAQWPLIFERTVVAPNEEYYSGLVFGSDSVEKRGERIREQAGRYYEHREEMAEAFDYVEESLRSLAVRFPAVLPGMKDDITLVVMPSLGRFNAKESDLGARPCAGFGVEAFIKGRNFHGMSREKQLPVAAAHEIFHIYHGSRTGLWQGADKPILTWIWIDGLATYASKVLNPGAKDDDVLMDPKMAAGCATRYKRYAEVIYPLLGSKEQTDQDALFKFGQHYKDLPPRAGYCVGFKAAEALSARYTLSEMSGWSEPEASLRLTELFKDWRAAGN